MASSTFKGRYQYYDTIKKRYNCKYPHNAIRNNANGVGIKYERYFKYCGLKENKGEK